MKRSVLLLAMMFIFSMSSFVAYASTSDPINRSGNGWYFRDCFKSEDVYEDANSRTKDITISPLASEDEFKYTWMFNIIIVQ